MSVDLGTMDCSESEAVVPCANCLAADTSGGTVHGKSVLKNSGNTTLRSALSLIYGITFPFPESVDNENLILCRNCNDLLFQLHHMFNHFRDLARSTSWIGAAHQDLINCKNIKTEIQEGVTAEGIQLTSAYMVQDAASQYEDPESDDDIFYDHSQYDGSPLRALASQYNLSFDSTLSVTDTPPVLLRAEDVYGSDTENAEGKELLLENWVMPRVIFEKEEDSIKTETPDLTGERIITRRPTLANPSTKRRSRGGRPKGSKNKVKIIKDLLAAKVIQSSDWEARRSERNQHLKIESAYSLAPETSFTETPQLFKRRPGRPARPIKDPLELNEPVADVPLSRSENKKLKAEMAAAEAQVPPPGTFSSAGRVSKPKRGRPFKTKPSLYGLKPVKVQNGTTQKFNEKDENVTFTRPKRLKVTVVTAAGKKSNRAVKSKPGSTITSSPSKTNGLSPQTSRLSTETKRVQIKKKPGRPKRPPYSIGDQKSENRTIIYRPVAAVKPKPKVGPGRPGPGGSLYVEQKPSVQDYSKSLKYVPGQTRPKVGPGKPGPGGSLFIRKPNSSLDLQIKPPQQVRCPTCSKAFLSKVAMMTHYEFVHNGDSGTARMKKYTCRKIGCTKTFLYATSLEAHEAAHVRKFTNPTTQAPAAPSSTQISADKAQVCHICDKDFHTASSLKTHLQEFHKINVETHMDKEITEAGQVTTSEQG